MNKTIEIHGKAERVSTSIGVATAFGVDQTNAEALLTDADMSLYEERRAARHYEFDRWERSSVISGVRQQAGKPEHRDAIPIRYQPIVRPNTGSLAGLEALAYTDTPDHSIRFHITGSAVLQAVTTDFTSPLWPHPATLHIPASSGELLHDHYLGHLDQMIGTQLDPAHLCITISEALLMTSGAELLAVLREIRKRGISVTLDNFGPGLSFLAVMHRLPITAIKIDGLFIHEIDTDSRARRSLVRTIELAHDLGMSVTAKDVASQSQATELADLHCDLAQGPYYGLPQPLSRWSSPQT